MRFSLSVDVKSRVVFTTMSPWNQTPKLSLFSSLMAQGITQQTASILVRRRSNINHAREKPESDKIASPCHGPCSSLPRCMLGQQAGSERQSFSYSLSLYLDLRAVMKCRGPACHRSASRRAPQMPSPFVMKMLCIDLSYAVKLWREGPFLNPRSAAADRGVTINTFHAG